MIKKVEHVAIIVADMETSIHFYTSLFGFALRTRGETKTRELAFLYHEAQPDFEIELIRDRTKAESFAQKGIVNHLAFTVDHMEEAISYYREKGIQFLAESPNPSIDGGKTIFFHGPNQEMLQLVEPSEERKRAGIKEE